ncbi:MAG: hypothetical protein ACRDV4_07190, partial [Acidimicrobiales bacterium]
VRIGIAPDLVGNADARLTLLTLCNHVVRFCPTVILDVDDDALGRECFEITASIRGEHHRMRRADEVGDPGAVDATVVVATVNPGPDAIVVNSDGWLARLASGSEAPRVLPMSAATPNAVGAIAAACLGSGEMFLRLIDFAIQSRNVELTMMTGESGPVGSFHRGPDLPESSARLDGLLVGCGNVGNGWTYAMRHLPV